MWVCPATARGVRAAEVRERAHALRRERGDLVVDGLEGDARVEVDAEARHDLAERQRLHTHAIVGERARVAPPGIARRGHGHEIHGREPPAPAAHARRE